MNFKRLEIFSDSRMNKNLLHLWKGEGISNDLLVPLFQAREDIHVEPCIKDYQFKIRMEICF